MPRVAASLAAGLGLFALLGWWLDQATLRNGFGFGVPMNPATAAAFIIAGASLWSLGVKSPAFWVRRVGSACAAALTLLAALKLGELLFGWPLAVDQILFPSRLSLPGNGPPNRMAPNTAFSLFLIGGALLLVRAPSEFWRLLGRSLALLGGLGGALTLLGYAYRKTMLTGVPGAIPMAVNTALGFVALAVGIIAVGAGREAPRPGEEPGQGLRRRVNLALAVAVGILFLTGGLSIWGVLRSRNDAGHRKESLLRRVQIATILESVQEAAIGQRDFLITGKSEFLEPYQNALALLPEQQHRAMTLLDRDTVQLRRLAVLSSLVREELALLAQTIQSRDVRRPVDAALVVETGRSNRIMGQIHQVFRVMAAHEEANVARWDARIRTDRRVSLFIIVIAGLLAVSFLILAGIAISADIRKRAEAEASLRESELILSSVGEGIHGIDLEGRIIFENPAAARMLGWDAADLIGKPAHATMHHHHADGTEYPQADCPIYSTLRDGQPRRVKEEVFWRRDGTSFPVDYTTAPLRDGGGRLYGSTVIFHDITERKQLEEERDRFFEISLDLLCIANTDGYFKRISPAFTDTLGWTVQELVDRPFLDFVHPDDRAATVQVVGQLAVGEPIRQFDNRYRHKNGAWRVISWKAMPQPGGFIFATGRDVTDAQEAETALRSAKEAAEAANRTKSDFLAKMSHELRTPLNAIIGFSEILEDGGAGSLNPKQQRYVANVLLSGRNLLQLINDILDLSKVEAGRMELTPSEFDVGTAVEQVRGIVEALSDKKGLTIHLDIPPGLPLLWADQAKFKQILYNLLGNAIKFTPEGGRVDVTARLVRPSGDGTPPEMLEVAVADTGIGIPSEHLTRIFNEFEQVNSDSHRQQEGTGLGLALTRKLVELHEGRVWVESEVGQGSVFRFTMPYPVARARVVGSASLPPGIAATDAAAPLVLVIDNDRGACDLLTHYLVEAGYRTECAFTGEEAIRLAQELHPAAITLDMLLPDRDGLLLLAQLKANPATRAIPVLVVSVTDRRQLGFSLGAADWLVKPIQKSALLAAMDRTIRRPSAGTPTILVVDDEPATVEYLTQLLRQRGFAVLTAPGGRAGIDLALSRDPDLILLDLMMPEVNGFDVVRILREHPRARQIPVLILTAMDLSQADAERLGSSVQAVIAKGGPERLLAELARICPVVPSALATLPAEGS